jgi:soluble lytic murein transglycosylase
MRELQARGVEPVHAPWSRRRRIFVWVAALAGRVGSISIVAIQRSRDSDDLRALIKTTALRHDLDPAFVEALVYAESGGNAEAVSRAGALGLMQLMVPTATEMAGRPQTEPLSQEELFDSAFNLELGCRYLVRLGKSFDGDTRLILIAYNAGQGNLRKWLRRTNDVDEILARHVPAETRAYVARVLAFWETIREEE